jgi:hypothetical protein
VGSLLPSDFPVPKAVVLTQPLLLLPLLLGGGSDHGEGVSFSFLVLNMVSCESCPAGGAPSFVFVTSQFCLLTAEMGGWRLFWGSTTLNLT